MIKGIDGQISLNTSKGYSCNSNLSVLIFSSILSISIATLSLAIVFVVDNYPITLASLVVALYCCMVVKSKFPPRSIIAYGMVVIFFVLNAIINQSWLNEVEFIKSFLLTSVMLFVYITSFDVKNSIIELIDWPTIFKYVVYLVVGFLSVQLFEQFILGSTFSWFWLDGISISTADDVGRFEAANSPGIFRPTSLYHEPSYLAVILFLLLLIHDRLFAGGLLRYILIASIVSTLSSSILSILSVYLIFDLWFRSKVILSWLSVILFVAFFFNAELVLEFSRLKEVSMEGTSGYIRVVEPFLETSRLLAVAPLGIPLGQSPIVFNNSLFLIPLYFGLFTPLVCLVWWWAILKRIKSLRYVLSYFFGVLSMLVVSGAIFTMESAFLLMLFNYAFISKAKV